LVIQLRSLDVRSWRNRDVEKWSQCLLQAAATVTSTADIWAHCGRSTMQRIRPELVKIPPIRTSLPPITARIFGEPFEIQGL
jgi:hypothetical protein